MQSITAITASDARARLFPLIQEIVEEETTVHITSKHGTIVLMSEAEYRAIMETLFVMGDPLNAKRISDAMLDLLNGVPFIPVDPKTLKRLDEPGV